jgi:hypothetical protein
MRSPAAVELLRRLREDPGTPAARVAAADKVLAEARRLRALLPGSRGSDTSDLARQIAQLEGRAGGLLRRVSAEDALRLRGDQVGDDKAAEGKAAMNAAIRGTSPGTQEAPSS